MTSIFVSLAFSCFLLCLGLALPSTSNLVPLLKDQFQSQQCLLAQSIPLLFSNQLRSTKPCQWKGRAAKVHLSVCTDSHNLSRGVGCLVLHYRAVQQQLTLPCGCGVCLTCSSLYINSWHDHYHQIFFGNKIALLSSWNPRQSVHLWFQGENIQRKLGRVVSD